MICDLNSDPAQENLSGSSHVYHNLWSMQSNDMFELSETITLVCLDIMYAA